jgi:hypothetical protein
MCLSRAERGAPDFEKGETYEGVVTQKGIGALRGKGLATSTPGSGRRRGSAEQAADHYDMMQNLGWALLGDWGQATCTACLTMCLSRTERGTPDFENRDRYLRGSSRPERDRSPSGQGVGGGLRSRLKITQK